MESFIWHRVSEKEKQEIRKQAKSIMDDFARALEKVKLKEEIAAVERDQDTREEKENKKSDKEFRKLIFKNAPCKKGDHFIAEKGGWVE